MARRAEAYRLRSGTVTTQVNRQVFTVVVACGYASVTPGKPKLAVVKPQYHLYIDHQTGMPSITLADIPENDPYAIPSWWPKLVGRAEFYFGQANNVLYKWHDQVYQKV